MFDEDINDLHRDTRGEQRENQGSPGDEARARGAEKAQARKDRRKQQQRDRRAKQTTTPYMREKKEKLALQARNMVHRATRG